MIFRKRSWVRRINTPILMAAALLVAAISLPLVYAAVTDIVLEPETGTLSGQARLLSDAQASGGQGIQYVDATACETTGAGGYPLPNLAGYANSCNTGPRQACTSTVGRITTSSHGQVIANVCATGIEVQHNNVTIRDVVVMGTGTYAIDIGEDMEANCPTNLRIEYTEVNMANAGNTDWGIYQRCAGGHVFDHIKIHNAGRPMMMEGNITITNSYFYAHRTLPESHRTALSTHGGDNYTITGNTFICYNDGCSSSVNMYSDYAPVTNYLFQGNILSGGTICLRAGDSHQYKEQAHDIRVINNRFSTVYNPECGCAQAFGAWDPTRPGNMESGNIWHETGQAVRSNFSAHLGCGPAHTEL